MLSTVSVKVRKLMKVDGRSSVRTEIWRVGLWLGLGLSLGLELVLRFGLVFVLGFDFALPLRLG